MTGETRSTMLFTIRFLCCLTILGCVSVHGVHSAEPDAPPLSRLQGYSPLGVSIAAHRGGYENDRKNGAPENSVANIRVCQRAGFQLYETDIQRTLDGKFVIVHDRTINRETSGEGSVSEMTWEQLRQQWKRYRDGSLSARRVATLEQFLLAGKGRTVFKADLKPGVSAYFDDIMKQVVECGAIDGIIFRVPYKESDLFFQYRSVGVPMKAHTLMFMVSSKEQVDDIKDRFDASTIQVNLEKSDPASRKSLELIRYAVSKGMVVETHAEGDERVWGKLVHAGVRLFHTNAPSKVKTFLGSLSTESPAELAD